MKQSTPHTCCSVLLQCWSLPMMNTFGRDKVKYKKLYIHDNKSLEIHRLEGDEEDVNR